MTTSTGLPATHAFSGWDVATLLDQQARLRSDHPFLIWEPFEAERQEWTYSEFSEATKRLAAGLAHRGIDQGDFVLIHLDNCPEFLLSWFACARLGAVAVTTNTRSAADELKYYADFANVKAAITHPKFASMVSEHCPGIEWLATTETDAGSFADTSAPHDLAFNTLFADGEAPHRQPDPSAPLCVMYTSGTTSRPKGVVWTHANGLWAARSSAFHLATQVSDINHVVLPLFHMNAMAGSTLPSMWVGATVVLQPRFSASRFWDVALRNRCTVGSLVPFCANALLQGDIPEHHFRMMGVGVNGLYDRKLKVPCLGFWGMTETVSAGIVGSPYHENTRFTLGRPSPLYEIAIHSAQGDPVAPEESGQLLIRGVPGLSLFDHYLNNREVTRSSFNEAGYFITGDRAQLNADGTISLLDRIKDMLKVGGENVSAAEVERVIQSLPGVSEVAVVAKPDKMLNEIPVAFVLAKGGQDHEQLARDAMSACERALADFKRPREVRIVNSLPRATLGKVAKAKLRQLLVEQ